MGNKSSRGKSGFYTPSSRSSRILSTPSAETPMTMSPVIDSNNDDVVAEQSTYFPDTFNNDINEMLAEIDDDIAMDAIDNDKYLNNNSLSFVPTHNYIDKISEIFTYCKQLGYGGSCRVLLVKDKNGKEYALKEMQKSDKLNSLLFATEHKILNKLSGHIHILSHHSSFIDKNCYYLATTYCSGGTMLDRIIKNGKFSELKCSKFIKNVLCGIQYMHYNNIVHRDIKCENLIFDKKGKNGIVKIIDFGTSEIINNPKQIDKVTIGSIHYIPPEMLSSKIRTKGMLYKGDMWSIGVLCYILMSGKLPFFGNNRFEELQCIKKGEFKWPQNINLSNCCKDFISSLLNIDINKRLNCDSALKHEWISKKGKALNIDFGDIYLNDIQLFSRANKLQKILINTILSEMEKTEKKHLLKALRDLNKNGNKIIDENDIINYILMNGKIINQKGHHKLNSFGIYPNNNNTNKLQLKQLSFNDIEIENILQEIDKLDEQKEDDDDIDIDNDDNEYILDLEHVEKLKMNISKFSSSQKNDIFISNQDDDLFPDLTPIPNTTISVERFSMIMNRTKTMNQSDVKSLVIKLKPTDSGCIPLKNIAMFNDQLPSKYE